MSKLRGNINYQVQRLFDQVRCYGQSKFSAKQSFYEEARQLGIVGNSQNFTERSGVYSIKTGDDYRIIWHDFLEYVKDNLRITSAEDLKTDAYRSYLEDRLSRTNNSNTLAQVNSALVKFAVGLNRLQGLDINHPERLKDLRSGVEVRQEFRTHVDNVRLAISQAYAGKELVKPEQCRAYKYPQLIRDNLTNEKYRIAARLIQETGMRIHECGLVRPSQLNENNQLNYIGKGGQNSMVTITPELAGSLRAYFEKDKEFRINKNCFRDAVKKAAEATNQTYTGVHGLRWNFAQETYDELIASGVPESQALLETAERMGHHREQITKHYLGRGQA